VRGVERLSAVAALVAASEGLPTMKLGTTFKVGTTPKVASFGAPLTSYATVRCYSSRHAEGALVVPSVLVALWFALVHSGGLEMEGLFRVQPPPHLCAAAEKELNKKARLKPGHAPEVLAALIKQWIRRLPGGLLGALPQDEIREIIADGGAELLLERLPRAERNVLLWLARVIQACASRREANKMSVSNLVLVVSPNLMASKGDVFGDLASMELSATVLSGVLSLEGFAA